MIATILRVIMTLERIGTIVPMFNNSKHAVTDVPLFLRLDYCSQLHSIFILQLPWLMSIVCGGSLITFAYHLLFPFPLKVHSVGLSYFQNRLVCLVLNISQFKARPHLLSKSYHSLIIQL